MKLDLGHILVIDVESTCWETKNTNNTSEIIQIGICDVNISDGSKIHGNIYVKPIQSEVSDYCTKLNGITNEILSEKAISYRAAVEILMADWPNGFGSKKVTWASFGDYDRYMFEKMCKLHTLDSGFDVPYPFCARHINVKNLCALKFRWDRERGMKGALNYLKIPLEGTHHNGEDDANNIATILSKIL